jgi:hypothetical protein
MKPPPHTTAQLAFDWTRFTLLVHPIQVAIVEAFLWIGQPLSAKDFSQMFADQIGQAATGTSYMSYHVRELAKVGVLEARGTESVRGAVRRFYFLAGARPACR